MRLPQSINQVPMIIPETSPTVAKVKDKSAASGKPNSAKVSAIPADVPCPPSKATSIKEAAMAGNLKIGVNTVIPSIKPMTYCPHPKICPKAACGAACRQIVRQPGIICPRNKVANTILMKIPGDFDHTVKIASGKIPFTRGRLLPIVVLIIAPKALGPNNKAIAPATTELGINKD